MRRGLLALRAAALAAALAAGPIGTAQARAAADGRDAVRAGHGGSLAVTPRTVAPGGTVRLRVSTCAGGSGRAESKAFTGSVRLAPAHDARPGGTGGGAGTDRPAALRHAHPVPAARSVIPASTLRRSAPPSAEDTRPALVGQASVRATAAPGGYDVTVVCDGDRGAGGKTVGNAVRVAAGAAPTASVHAREDGAARLGANTRARADQDGPGIRQTVMGLVLAGVAAVAVAFRSGRGRRRDRS